MWSATCGFFALQSGNVFSPEEGKVGNELNTSCELNKDCSSPNHLRMLTLSLPWRVALAPEMANTNLCVPLDQSRGGDGGWHSTAEWQCWLWKGCVGRLEPGHWGWHGTWASLTVSSLGCISPKMKMVSPVCTQISWCIYVAKCGL